MTENEVAREWVLESQWGDMDADALADLADERATRGVAHHLAGAAHQLVLDIPGDLL